MYLIEEEIEKKVSIGLPSRYISLIQFFIELNNEATYEVGTQEIDWTKVWELELLDFDRQKNEETDMRER